MERKGKPVVGRLVGKGGNGVGWNGGGLVGANCALGDPPFGFRPPC